MRGAAIKTWHRNFQGLTPQLSRPDTDRQDLTPIDIDQDAWGIDPVRHNAGLY
jgi:hypothetical protein